MPASSLFTPSGLRDELRRRTSFEILIVITRNRRRMVSIRRQAPAIFEVRLQEIFLNATSGVLDELAGMISGRHGDRSAIRDFVAANFSADAEASFQSRTPPAPAPDAGRGHHHDLAAYADELNRLYLRGRSTASITWGRRNNSRRRVRSIRFGCYDPSRDIIIMNRKLDSAGIPRFFVEYILFHEMLHGVLGIGERADGSRDIHGKIFKLMESTFPDLDKALRFEKEFCRQLGIL